MTKEEHKLKNHKLRTLKRSILQKDNIRLWKRLELYQEEDNTPKYNLEGYDYMTKHNLYGYNDYIEEQTDKEMALIYNKIDAEIH